MDSQLSCHARSRAQQRGIAPVIFEWAISYGAVAHDHHGAEIHYFDKKAKKRLASAVGQVVVDRLTPLLDAYVVTNGDKVITVGHRYKPVRKQ